MTEVQLSIDDIQQIQNHGLTEEEVQRQLNLFKKGIPLVNLVQAATVEKGIWTLSEEAIEKYSNDYEQAAVEALKFVPASGAATRMFKLLHQFIQEVEAKATTFKEVLKKKEYQSLQVFFNYIEDFAFYPTAIKRFNKVYEKTFPKNETDRKIAFLKFLLQESGLNFSNLPKGLIPFHKYETKIYTAFEEHLAEATLYAAKKQLPKLHFTVTETALEKFKETAEAYVAKEAKTRFDITYSFQKKTTDTIAVNLDNTPYRNQNNELCFRPGGHGALIENLNEFDADIIFIKNIDNVVVKKNREQIARYKKALAGILLNIQDEVFIMLRAITKGEYPSKAQTNNLLKKLNITTQPDSIAELKTLLNRPIRVCGMVENQGAPGGGPFWVKDNQGIVSLQIVEGAQIDHSDKAQHNIAQEATHFNPVDLVCGVRNYKGEKFNLLHYVNPNNGFISNKSVNGTTIKALELPGLWNGAMAYWNTIFVEVPLITFNPVKTVFDLLKPAHQPVCHE